MAALKQKPLLLRSDVHHIIALLVYLLICICDFIVMPAYYGVINQNERVNNVVQQSLKFSDATVQIEALKTLKSEQTWTPLTLQGGGLFHLAFGAILGVSSFRRSFGQQYVPDNYPNRDYDPQQARVIQTPKGNVVNPDA